MKRIVAFLLALLMVFMPLGVAPADTCYCAPRYEYVTSDTSWWALAEDYGVSAQDFVDILTKHYMIGDCTFDKALWVNINSEQILNLPIYYEDHEYICGIFANTDGKYVMYNYPQQDGSILFCLDDIPSDNYLLLLFKGWKID